MKITINGTEKEVELKQIYTREVDRNYNNALMEWVKANPNNPNEIDIPLNNIQKANDILVESMTNLTTEEINMMTWKDFNKVLWEIIRIKNGS